MGRWYYDSCARASSGSTISRIRRSGMKAVAGHTCAIESSPRSDGARRQAFLQFRSTGCWTGPLFIVVAFRELLRCQQRHKAFLAAAKGLISLKGFGRIGIGRSIFLVGSLASALVSLAVGLLIRQLLKMWLRRSSEGESKDFCFPAYQFLCGAPAKQSRAAPLSLILFVSSVPLPPGTSLR